MLTHSKAGTTMKLRTHAAVLAIAFLLLLASVAQAQPGATLKPAASKVAALDAVPSNALGVVIVNNLAETDAKIATVARLLQLPVPSPLFMAKMTAGIKEGLDEKSVALGAVFPGKDEAGPPLVAVFVPVTDYKKFIAQFEPADDTTDVTQVQIGNSTATVGQKGNFAVFGPAERGEELKAVIEAKTGLAAEFAPIGSFINQQQVAGVVTTAGLKTTVAAARQGLAAARKALEGAGEQGKMALNAFAMYDELFKVLESDVTHLAIGSRIDKEGGVHLTSRSIFKKGGSLAKASQGIKPASGEGLAKLAPGPFLFAGEFVIPAEWMSGMMQWSMEMMQTTSGEKAEKLSEEDAKKLADSMAASMKGVHSMAMVMGLPKSGESIYSSTTGIIIVDNAKEYMANYKLALAEMNETVGKLENPLMPAYEVQEIKIDGVAALEITTDMSKVMQQGGGDPNVARMMELFVGKDGKLNIYVAPVDETTIALAYVSKEQLTKTIAAAKAGSAGFATDSNVAATAASLPKGAQWVGYLSPEGVMVFAQQMIAVIGGPDAAGRLPKFPASPPIGFSATITGTQLDTHLVIPSGLLKETGEFIQEIQKKQAEAAEGAIGPAESNIQ